MRLENKQSSNSYCSNKNCQLPNSRILNRLKQEIKKTWEQLADIYEVSERSIRRHANPSDKPKQLRGRKRKFEGKNLDLLRNYTITIQIITQEFLAQKYSCSQSTICLSLRRAGVVYKGFTYQATEQSRRKNKEQIKYFIEVLIPFLLKSGANIFFLDESGFHLGMVPRRGYYLKGSRLICKKPGDKGKNRSLILLAQITDEEEKIIHWKTEEGGVNSKKLHEFLSDFNPPNNGKRNVLIMDNLSAHRATKSCWKQGLTSIKELIDSKNTEIIFLPSYTPELNPIEPMNSIIKRHARKKQAREKDKLDLVIGEKIKIFKQESTVKYLESSIKECSMKLAFASRYRPYLTFQNNNNFYLVGCIPLSPPPVYR